MNPVNKDRFSRRALLKSMGVSAAMLPLIHAERAQSATPERLSQALRGGHPRQRRAWPAPFTRRATS